MGKSRRRIFQARIEMVPRSSKTGADKVQEMIELDMWALSDPEIKPEVTVTEEKADG